MKIFDFNEKRFKNKIVHLLLVEKFTDSFIEFINSSFPKEEHDFIIYGPQIHEGIELHSCKYRNVKRIKSGALFKRKYLKKFLLKHKKIIIHALFEPNVIDMWFENKELLSKTFLYLWGGDYYLEEIKLAENYEKRRFIIQNAAGIINILRCENDVVSKWYKPKGNLFHAVYIDLTKKEMPFLHKGNNDILKIQIGNSATKSNSHKEILNELLKYKEEDICIYVPLAYGDMRYADEVSIYGKQLFGEKFIAINTFMEKDAYCSFIEEMDVAIFGMSRQQALGNITLCLESGSIVYLKKDTILDMYYTKDLGCTIKYIEEIKNMNFDEFRNATEEEKKKNVEILRKAYSREIVVSQWDMVFNS